jgi:hypothetical protein
MRRPSSRSVSPFVLLIPAASFFVANVARAAPPWVDRNLTLPSGDWAFDFGLGVGHVDAPPDSPTGVGINLEAAVAPIRGLELGFRTGLRMGDDARDTHADEYGRLFDRQTFDTGNGTFANPEVRVTGSVLRGPIVELGLEGRVFLPVNTGTDFGVMFGVPLLFHLGSRARIDTGVYVPVLFTTPVDTYFSAPIDVWFQVTPRLWLGPESGIVFHSVNNHVSVPLGFGLGYQITHALDLKTQILFPAINDNQGAQSFGLGVGIQVRVD